LLHLLSDGKVNYQFNSMGRRIVFLLLALNV
jgi:hypothetical protein